MHTTSNHIQLELHVPDFDKTIAFYTKLGFRQVWVRKQGDIDDYLVLERDGMVLNFWPGNAYVYEQSFFKRFPSDTVRGYGVEIIMMVEDVLAIHEEIKNSVTIVDPLMKRPWGLWDFRVTDPFGYYIRITEKHDILDSGNAVK